jgi:3'-phosphoadenosine 5'-phosphosulfate sulfotransferase (PAPS reductase)/FAD synthetase
MSSVRHVLGISGGKDSAALAIYLKRLGIVPEMEYYFADTGCELQETYDFIDKLEVYLGNKITRIGNEAPFEHHLFLQGNMLPSPRQRWCTVKMKLEPFERFVGTDEVRSYIAIRADEHREGYISTKPNIKPIFPFIHDGIIRKDVFRLLEETVGIPEYYKWRSRSGCYFCFFQQQSEWIGLYDNHPDLFKKAMEFEKFNPYTKEGYSWVQGMSLAELIQKKNEIVSIAQRRKDVQDNRSWQEKLLSGCDTEDQGCLICSL